MLQIYSTFEHSSFLELAISSLEQNGIGRENIFAVPLTARNIKPQLFDTLHHSDGISFVSTGAAIATAFAVIGASVGFKLAWGPIYWGLIGAVSGFLLGFCIDLTLYMSKKNKTRRRRGKFSEVIIIVECIEDEGDTVESICWHHHALGIARVKI